MNLTVVFGLLPPPLAARTPQEWKRERLMRQCFFLIVLATCLLSGCMVHSLGSKKVSFDRDYTDAQLDKNKSLYVAVVEPFPAEASDTPDFIALQFSKFISSAVRAALPGDLVDNVTTGIQAAREHGGEYFVALQVVQWKEHSILSPGHKASFNVSVFDAESGAMLSKAMVAATCYAMAMGLEGSPRECVRPQVDLWTQQTFGVDSRSLPQRDLSTFPR